MNNSLFKISVTSTSERLAK